MADIKIQGWMTLPSVAEARKLVGEVIHICVGGNICSGGTSLFDLFRFARVRCVREPITTDHICPHCGKSAQIAFDVAWESEFTDAHAMEVCENCTHGCVTKGSDLLSFGK